jgi:hypothetical protein
MSKDEYSPEARLNTVLGDHKTFFTLLRTIRQEYIASDDVTKMSFNDWLLERYGIQLQLNSDGRITADYTIVDQHKYLICKLKYPL